MVLLALRRASITTLSLDWLLIDDLERLSKQVYRITQQIADDTVDKKTSISSRKRRRVKEEQWTVQRDGEHDTIKIIHGDDDDDNIINNNLPSSSEDVHTIQLLTNTLQTVRNLTTKIIPEISSRIIHATSPVLHELSRGFFVPFLTVALACLGRIHVLLLRLGRELVGTLSQHVPKLRECVVVGIGGVRRMNKGEGGSGEWIKLEEAISSPLFRVHTMKGGSDSGDGCQNEWNDLMRPFIEVSHDDFTKKVNTFVQERRWKDALAAFGIKEGNLNKIQMSSQSNAQEGNEEGSNDVNNMSSNDMGELVYMQPDQCDENDTIKRTNIDDNMARVLDNKRRIDDKSTTSTAKKKKRRKKKTKNLGDSEDTQEDAADVSAKVERKESAGNVIQIAKESVKEESKQKDTISSSDEHLQALTISSKESAIGGDEVLLDADESEVKPSAKKQKKAKKKKAKKKKNVIDDIFG